MLLRRRRPAPRRRLGRAQELLRRGNFVEAAQVFEKLAQEAEDRGMLDRAGDSRLQAARCYLELNNTERADQEGLHALRLFLRARRPRKVRRLLPKMVAALEKHGRHKEAEELRKRAEELLGSLRARVGAGPGPGPARHGTLPGKCPACGAPVKPNEANWVGQDSAECPYCGSVITAEAPR
jgi:thioredoxin-like negative regulator of GroEL/DNA-directed RNA polymerase subunit RPC12/RpoP